MGVHISGQSYLFDRPDISLSKYVSDVPECLGVASREKFGRTLPFLFKVLSIDRALSIQAHPSKKHAEELHNSRPDLYKDPNHKPELAIALTPFEALLAFRPPAEIATFIQAIPELVEIVGTDCLQDLVDVACSSDQENNTASITIKAAYQQLMRTDPVKVAFLVNALADRLMQKDRAENCNPDGGINSSIAGVFVRLAMEYPGDVGCFSLFFLNYVQLQPGQAIFLEANLPHAYLSGDCIECMACSDNVIRAGLTPKYKDVDCLLDMLQYEPRTVSDLLFPGEALSIEHDPLVWPMESKPVVTGEPMVTEQPEPQVLISRFAPPVDDFAVDRIEIPQTIQSFELLSVDSASILLFIHGSGEMIQTEFIPPTPVPIIDRTQSVVSHDVVVPVQLPKPAGRIPLTISFTRGSVIFIGAGISCFIHLHPPHQSLDKHHGPCLAFRAFSNCTLKSEQSQTQ